MGKNILKLFVIFSLLFSFSYSQKVITNRALKKYHHSEKKKRGNKKNNLNKNNSQKVIKSRYTKSDLFGSTKDASSSALAEKIVTEMNRLEYLKRKFLDENDKLWKINKKIEKVKIDGGSVPSYLLKEREVERERIEKINREMINLECQIAEDLRKANEMGILKDKAILKDYKTKEEMEKEAKEEGK